MLRIKKVADYMMEELELANRGRVSGVSLLLDDSNDAVEFTDCIKGAEEEV